MTTLELILSFTGGLILLFIGAEGLVRGSSSLALRMKITPLLIGLTVVSFGTSAPELGVSIKAAVEGNAGIALGNVIGSNIANVALILGVAALIKPLKVQAKVISREIPVMIGISVIFIILLLDGELSFSDGIIFVSLLVIYIIVMFRLSKKEKNPAVDAEFEKGIKRGLSLTISIIFTIGGLLLLIIGADYFVKSAIQIARALNMSEAVIGLTIVAIGTSVPELVTSAVASLKNEADIAIGNVVGSNIMNILLILGITSIIITISAADISIIDLAFMLLLSILLLPMSRTKYSLSRYEGGLLLLAYSLYMYYLILF
jgi:cation:H+ antiporter